MDFADVAGSFKDKEIECINKRLKQLVGEQLDYKEDGAIFKFNSFQNLYLAVTVESKKAAYLRRDIFKRERRKAHLANDEEGYNLIVLKELTIESDCYEFVYERAK